MFRDLHPLSKVCLIGTAFLVLFLFSAGALAAEEPDPGKAALGKHLYRSYCSACHGENAEGDGSIAEMLTVPPADLTVLTKNNDGQFPTERTRKIIDGREKVKGHGTGEMPAWGDAFQAISEGEEAVAAKIDKLVNFLMSIQKE